MFSIDAFQIEILADGTIKSTMDAVSPANHDNAEQFLKAMAHLAGGETVRQPRTDIKGHRHERVDAEHHVHQKGGSS